MYNFFAHRVQESVYIFVFVEIQVACYGSIIYLLQRNTNLLLPVRFDGKTASFVEILIDQLNLREAESMRFLMVLFRAVLSEGKSANDWETPVLVQIGRIYSWLIRRIQFADCAVDFFHADVVSSENWNQHTLSKVDLFLNFRSKTFQHVFVLVESGGLAEVRNERYSG
jgi:hypothetical protein